ncbi:putative membrane transporter protein [Azospirillaceae bacterium]
MTELTALDWSGLVPLAGGLLAAGLCAGLIAGLLGVGGGIVIVPALLQVFAILDVDIAIRMHMAVGTSLASIVTTAISSIHAHHKRQAIDIPLLWKWSPSVVVGVVLGTAIASLVKGSTLSTIFGSFALTVSAYMAFVRSDLRLRDGLPAGPIKHAIGVFIGCLSSMVGIGGGTLSVPTMVLCNYPIRRAVGTAAAIGLTIALPGAIGFIITGWNAPGRPPLSLGYVSLIGLCLTSPAGMLAAPLGARIAHNIKPIYLRRMFSVFLALVAAKMLLR